MQHEIKAKPDFAALTVQLDQGEQVVTEAGAMMGMSGGLTMETNMKGGLLGAAKRALGGESIFMNTYTADSDGQRIDIAPRMPGDIHFEQLDGNTLFVQSGSYLASGPDVLVDSKWGGAKTFFGGEGLFMLKIDGSGPLWISSYGAIHEVAVTGTYVVDTGHIVGFEDSLTFHVKKVGGLKSLFFSGEGLVCEFSGHGRLWIQTRNAPSLAGFLHPFRRVKQKSN